MQPTPPPLVSFYCQCGTPLSAAVGTPSVRCHQCGTTMGVPVEAPPGPAPPSLRPARGGGKLMVLGGVVGALGVFAKAGGSALHSDPSVTTNAMLALLVLGGVLVAVGVARR